VRPGCFYGLQNLYVVINMQKSKLEKVTKVITHAYCPDGISSAIILKDALGLTNDQIVFCQYNSPEHKNLIAEPGLLFCDFSPPRERIQEFVDAGAIVLDHHEHAKDIVAAFGENGVFADKNIRPEVSGARLAYEEVWLGMIGPVLPCSIRLRIRSSGQQLHESEWSNQFIDYLSNLAGIRDNWQVQNSLWPEACEQAALLMFFGAEEWLNYTVEELAFRWNTKYKWLGKVLIKKENEAAKGIAEKRWTYRSVSGLVIAIVPSRNISDASDLLEDECGVVIGFSYAKNEPGRFPEMIVSLRSFGDSFDCGAFCKLHGGGGHVNAGGCKFETLEDTGNPYSFICRKIDDYESLHKFAVN
jgi:hypothetical protein